MLDGGRRNYNEQMPGGTGDLTLADLEEMAARQQQQMEAQHQVLVAKEQRLKYLRQQEARHAQLASEGERVRKMKERVESQELKLKKLRALRGQAEMYRTNNNNLNGELDAVKAVFNEKEKELALAVARVDRLNRQLQELRTGNNNNNSSSNLHQVDNKQAAVSAELEKLRNELLIRNKLNEQQSNTISAKEKMLVQRREEVTRMDARIRELQQRLRKRQAQEANLRQQQQQQQQQQQMGGPVSPSHRNNVVDRTLTTNSVPQPHTVNSNFGRNTDPYIPYSSQNVAKDDLYSKSRPAPPMGVGGGSGGESGSFFKQDPKYQTLPARVKFSPPSSTETGYNQGRGGKRAETNNNDQTEESEDYQLPTVVSPAIGTNSQKGVNQDTVAYYQNLKIPQPGRKDMVHPGPHLSTFGHPTPSSGHHASGSRYYPPQTSGTKISYSQPGGDGLDRSSRPGTLNPVINIHEEERQAGSGQSSPASSEASSGGIQVKVDSEINSSPIGPVSAMIERLNRGALPSAAETPDPHPAASAQDKSIFTHRNGHTRIDQKASGKPQQPPAPSTSSSSSSSSSHPPEAANGSSRQNQTQDGQPSPSVGVRSRDETDSCGSSRPVAGLSDHSHGPPISSTVSSGTAAPHLNQKPAPTYRYASKSQIANTYMGRLGSGAMDKYQKNLNQIYRTMDGPSSPAQPVEEGGQNSERQEAKTSFSQSTGSSAEVSTASTDHPPQFGVVSSPGYPDIASDKGSFKLNTPKQVRRRHSDSENEDLNKALQERREVEQRQKDESTATDSTPDPKTMPSKSADSRAGKDNQNSVSAQSKDPPTNKTASSDASRDKPKSSQDGNSPSMSDTSNKPDVSAEASPQVTGSSEPTSPGPGKVRAARRSKSNLKREGAGRQSNNRVSFDPLALLLDASLEGELDLVRKVAVQVDDVSTPNDEGITALHNAICAGHYDIVKVLVEFGCDVNSPDSDGWTPLHCAASCNNLPMVRFLVEHGACVFATTISDQETAADKCEEDEDGYDGCSDYLYSIQEKLGITNSSEVYGVFDYQATKTDELSFQIGDRLSVLRKGDDTEKEWWWARLNGHEGYIPRNFLGLYPRVIPGPKEVSDC